MSATGVNINGTAGSEDVKLVRSVRQRYAEKVDMDEISGGRMMHAQSKEESRGANVIAFKSSPRGLLTDTWDAMRDGIFSIFGHFSVTVAIRDNRISMIGQFFLDECLFLLSVARGKSMHV